jgi:hypothetical protein
VILILKKRIFIPVLTILFLLLILTVRHFHPGTSTYAFVVNDWDQVVGSRGLDVRRTNMSFHLVSMPTGTKVRRLYGVDSWIEIITAAPNRQIGIIEGVFSPFKQTGNILHLWSGMVRTFPLDHQLQEPNVWSPDSAYLTVGIRRPCRCDQRRFYNELGIFDVNSGDVRVLTDGEAVHQDFRSVTWSPDGTALVYANNQIDPALPPEETIKWISVAGDEPGRTLFTGNGASSMFVRWLPDGKHIALIAPEIRFVDVQTAQVTFHYPGTAYFETCWSPITNHFIATSQTDFKLITPAGVPPLDMSFVDPSIWQQPSVLYDACTWSPDGKKIALIQANHPLAPIVQIIDLENRTTTPIYVDHKARFLIPYWSPDSRLLALKTYRPVLDSGDTYIYDITTMQQLLYQSHANFLLWLPEFP